MDQKECIKMAQNFFPLTNNKMASSGRQVRSLLESESR